MKKLELRLLIKALEELDIRYELKKETISIFYSAGGDDFFSRIRLDTLREYDINDPYYEVAPPKLYQVYQKLEKQELRIKKLNKLI